MGAPTTYATFNSFNPSSGSGGGFVPATFGVTYGVRALNPSSLATLWTVTTSGPAGHMVMSPDGTTLYVAEANISQSGADPARSGSNVGNRVYLVDTASHTETSVWTLPLFKVGSAYKGAPILSSLTFSPDGSEIWVMYCRLEGNAPTGAPFETLSPPGSQIFVGSIESFDAVTHAHIGTLAGPCYANSVEQASSPYLAYFLTSNPHDLSPAPICCPLALSPDGATLYSTATVPDGSLTGGFGTVYYRLYALFKYTVSPPSGGGRYSLSGPTTLSAGNVTSQPRDAFGNPAPGAINQVLGQLFVSTDAAKVYVSIAGGAVFRSVNASTGALITTATNPDGTTGGYGWHSFAFDHTSGVVQYGSFVSSNSATPGNAIHTIAEASIGSTPTRAGLNGNVLFHMDAFNGFFFGTSPLLETSTSGSGFDTAAISHLLFKLSGSTLTSVSLPSAGWCVLADSGAGTGTPGTGANAAGMQVVWDGHRRPCAIDASTGVRFLSSKDAGHTFDPYVVTAATSKDPSLFIDRRTNTPRAIYGNGSTGLLVATATQDGEQSDWGTSTAVTGLSGAFPVAHEHPTDAGRVLMAYLDSGTLKTAVSYDGGAPATWQALGTVDTALDFTSAGRAGLCWLGEAAFVAYRSGVNLLVRKSLDGGATWGSAVTVSTGGPHHGISLAGHEGQLVLAAQDAGALHLWTSGDLGAAGTWAAGTAPTSPVYPAALAVEPWTGRWFFGTGIVSRNQGGAWTAP